MKKHKRKGPWIVAHRGAMDEAPENTRSAFDRALAHPIDGIELDVQMTKDGELVLYHDENLARMKRANRRIADLDHEELRRLDWGGWFSNDFQGESLPTLTDTLDRFASRTRLLIEIKSFDDDQRSGRSLDITARVLQLLDQRVSTTFADNIFILSFDPGILRRASESTSRRRCVFNVQDPAAAMRDAGELFPRLYACCASIHRLEPPVVESWREHGKAIMTYSCNTPGEVERALGLGCDVVMTDRPRWIFPYLAQRTSKRAESPDR
jgi:glycerophosphoryl diester phosphodiesterase